MTRIELNKFQAILAGKQAEVARAAGRREGLAIERTSDLLDALQLASERELTGRGLERESKLLRNVHAALQRIADGTYGACLECDEEISHKRLNAVPWATLCIGCQERADRDSESELSFQQTFPKAA